MTMGTREKLHGGMEWEGLTRGGRRYHSFRSRTRAWIKRKFWKRTRRAHKPTIPEAVEEIDNRQLDDGIVDYYVEKRNERD